MLPISTTIKRAYKEGDTAVIKGRCSDQLLGEPNQAYAGQAIWSDEFEPRELMINDDGTFETKRDLASVLGMGSRLLI